MKIKIFVLVTVILFQLAIFTVNLALFNDNLISAWTGMATGLCVIMIIGEVKQFKKKPGDKEDV